MGARGSIPETFEPRVEGEILNKYGHPARAEHVITPSMDRHKRAICRCWRSKRMPLCDNTHQFLQLQGIKVGPVAIDIRAAPQPSRSTPRLLNVGAGRASLAGAVVVAACSAGAHFVGLF
uniref:Iron-binding zinc finger CDGSH type domain-containing protein n=1 Tax=Chromera velia CCMP2878 TaxID=1169474 RepID=A0A0G4FPF4_9ALVE|mmetsp:Transcript_8299/g.16149  ORF Transcript_8299/g.16149 Transcript_8299/m.16149 type:complete len:120 (+) Transcript_8299:181-540(+)|eukprot:Cvel_18089.t1-p1 / transcript=Cvel_18089.t1 / gene=Cvel_18089 / organism=Chromera_velia_CCMP2878 / gene_product=hypothetical protein / transcript_product=hypothetical protein / location=Cvel_scaffold1481:44138-44577(+) / protein_length=119 / sequence_SO=supercontig / SO=protein_coding / is_pseudo=false